MRRIIGFEVKTLDNMITRGVLADAKMAGEETLTPVQIRIMRYLFVNQDKEIFQKDIENNFVVRRSTASGILRTMEKNNMIQRIGTDSDLRVKRIVLTDKYINRINELEERTDRFQEKLLTDISDSELNAFFTVIDKMKDNLSK